jgi:hypothetical protein
LTHPFPNKLSQKATNQKDIKTQIVMNGAYFTKIFHRSVPRGQSAVQQQATKKSKDLNSSTKKRSVATLAGEDGPKERDSRWSIWDQDSLDPEMMAWFFFPS